MIIFAIIGIHLIGAIITLIIFNKDGTFEDAAKYGDGIHTCTPSDLVFYALFVWEFYWMLCAIEYINVWIDNYFKNKYKDK